MRLLPLAGFILISFIPSVGGLATEANKDWYRVLVKPWFTPPEWVFGTVWPVLFFILGFAAYRAWEVGGKARVTYVQLFLLILRCSRDGAGYFLPSKVCGVAWRYF